MMAKGTVNKVLLVGRLGQDPDIRYSPSGTAIARFSLATNERVPAGEGNWEDRTEWHRIVAFGKTAEVCGNFLAKGRLVFVEGSIRSSQWEDQQGQKRISYDIVARDIQMLGSGEGQGQGQWQGQSQGQQGQGQWQQGQPQGQGQSQNYGQSQGGHQGQARNAGPAGRTAVEELPPNMGPPDDDIPF
jgi:single-strand DNA-binding protein